MSGMKMIEDEGTTLTLALDIKQEVADAIKSTLSGDRDDDRDALLAHACLAWNSGALRDEEMIAFLRFLSPERFAEIKDKFAPDLFDPPMEPDALTWASVVEELVKHGPTPQGVYALACYGYLLDIIPRPAFEHLAAATLSPETLEGIQKMDDEELGSFLCESVQETEEKHLA